VSAFQNTTIGVIVTNGKLNKQSASTVARMGSLGITKAVSPGQTIYDGDIVFTLASGQIEVDYHTVGLIAEEMLIKAIIRGVTKAKEVKGIPSFLSLR
jgi:L-aminopeptidase/D-esterase-like protein